MSLFESEIVIQEIVITVHRTTIDELSSRIRALDLTAKRALFAERIPKPVFFDTAFNYIDMPMDELLVLAGKRTAMVTPVSEKIAEAVAPAVKRVMGREITKETMPGIDEKEGGGENGEKPKAWLGGWFGRG